MCIICNRDCMQSAQYTLKQYMWNSSASMYKFSHQKCIISAFITILML